MGRLLSAQLLNRPDFAGCADNNSAGLAEATIANRIERCMRLELIPVRDGSDVVLTLEIAALLSTDLLPFHTQIMFEINRIGNVPAIQSAGHRRIHIPIRALAM